MLSLFQKLKALGITLSADGKGGLVVKGNKSKLTKSLISEISDNKMEILQWLEEQNVRTQMQINKRTRQTEQEVLSFAQQRMWFLDKMHANSVYSMPVSYSYEGVLHLTHLTTALRQVIARHEILRTVYRESEGKVYQYVLSGAAENFELQHVDKSYIDWENDSKHINHFISEQVNKTFDLSSDIMLRVMHIKRSTERGILLFNSHHIASDGWSIKVLIKEVFQFYQAAVKGETLELPPLPVQYADFACWQRKYLVGDVLDQQMEYWKGNLAGVDSVHSIPLDKIRPAQKQHHGEHYSVTVSAEVAQRLESLADANKLSFFMLLQGALALQLATHTGKPDVVMTTPVANRLQPEIKEVIGLFANTLVLRTQAHQEILADFFKHILHVHNGAQASQDIPFEQLVEALHLPRTAAHNPLAQILVTLQSEQEQQNLVDGVGIETEGLTLSQGYSGGLHSRFDLEVCFSISSQGITSNWLFDSSLFEQQHIARLADNFNLLLQRMAQVDDATQTKLRTLKLPQANDIQEMQRFLRGNEATKQNSVLNSAQAIHCIVEHFATHSPDTIAVQYDQEVLSFSRLNELAKRTAKALLERPNPQSLTGLCIEPSVDMIVAILGILKSGAAYVPLDPNNPQQRIEYILADANIDTVIVGQQNQAVSVPPGINVLTVEQLQELGKASSVALPEVADSQLAYVIYTSGTSGTPKGVAVAHRQVGHYLSMAGEYLSHDIDSSVLSTSIAFDATVTTLFGGWLQGKSVTVLPASENPILALQNALQSDKNCLFKVTPSQLQAVRLSESNYSRHVIVVGGEAFPRKLAESACAMFPNSIFVNEYGPTETTVGCCYQVFTAAQLPEMATNYSIPIGKPGKNVVCAVLDPQGELLSLGSVGELYIGGEGLSRGYLRQPELTRDKFISYPDSLKVLDYQTERLYRSGDRVRHLPNGVLEYLGRVDQQIKLRGYRIEPGEIEYYLNRHPLLDSSIVCVSEKDKQRLVAYVKLAAPTENYTDMAKQLGQYLSRHLPSYMVPGQFYVVSDWQLTTNGKIDFSAMADAVLATDCAEHQNPKTETEEKLRRVWGQMLDIEESSISTGADFFELGGHSLAMVSLSYHISQVFGVQQLELKELLNTPTIEEMARLIDFEVGDKFSGIATDDIDW